MHKTAKIRFFYILNSIYNTLFIGKVFNHYENLPSTNILALEMLGNEQISEGTVFSTFAQTDGRGQINNKWESEPQKNLSLSIVLKPEFLPVQKYFLLTQAIALGVYDFIRLYVSKEVWIKWPNDIYIGKEKIAGILIQNTIQANQFQYSVVGIGININQTVFKSDPPNPTSIFLQTGKEIPLWSCIEYLCKYLENRYLQLKSNQYDTLREDYHEVLYQINEWHFFEKENTRFEGKITRVLDDGFLQMETENGLELFNFKEVKFL